MLWINVSFYILHCVAINIGRYCHKVVTLFRAEKLSNKIVSGTGHLWLFRLFYLHRKHYLQRNSNKICSWKWVDRKQKQKQKQRILSGMSPHFNLDESFQVVVWQTARKQKVLHTRECNRHRNSSPSILNIFGQYLSIWHKEHLEVH